MEKRKWMPLKEMLFMYLAVNKIIYWTNLVGSSVDGLGRVVAERLLNQDIVLVILIVGLYFFEKKLVQMHDKLNRLAVDILVAIVGYVMLTVVITLYSAAINFIFTTPFSLRDFIMSPLMRDWSIVYFIVMVVMTVKENVKRRVAPEDVQAALDIECANIKCEMLQTLLDDGVLSREEFDKQEAKLR